VATTAARHYYPIFEGNDFVRVWQQQSNISTSIKSHHPSGINNISIGLTNLYANGIRGSGVVRLTARFLHAGARMEVTWTTPFHPRCRSRPAAGDTPPSRAGPENVALVIVPARFRQISRLRCLCSSAGRNPIISPSAIHGRRRRCGPILTQIGNRPWRNSAVGHGAEACPSSDPLELDDPGLSIS